ncbi:MAG: hypothetical protein ACOY94_16070 [Bacillota bacterium]
MRKLVITLTVVALLAIMATAALAEGRPMLPGPGLTSTGRTVE